MKRNSPGHLALAAADGDQLAYPAQTADPCSVDGRGDDGALHAEPSGSGGRVADMPRRDVIQYIAEMCDALAYMASAHQCNDLANLLHEAAAEADRCEQTEC